MIRVNAPKIVKINANYEGGRKNLTRFRGGMREKNCLKTNHVMHRFQLGPKKYPISTNNAKLITRKFLPYRGGRR